jgi:hypothetical protein
MKMEKNVKDDLCNFFMARYESTKTLLVTFQHVVKKQVLNIVSDAGELR